ncbi:hypothetical protein FRC0313_02178 [Corynebacterium diphtheriae]|nr:hypothetical protein CIP107514_02157 [Corynebacterium diphtheriae]CAB0863263.1 hypothetical protein FRC0313_02178 [Corynebacterium diphtheriae]CAB0919992.1 hypothetical protein FRC0417_02184 [Corynebacterium diphtheriae]
MRKKLRRLSTTRWCRVAFDFLDAAVRFLQQGPRALIPQHVLRVERACVHCLAVCHETPSFGATILQASWSNLPWHVRGFSHLLKRNKTWSTSNAAGMIPTSPTLADTPRRYGSASGFLNAACCAHIRFLLNHTRLRGFFLPLGALELTKIVFLLRRHTRTSHRGRTQCSNDEG